MLVLGDDEADAWMRQKGSERPNLDVLGSNSRPFASDSEQIGATRQPMAARKTEPCITHMRLAR
jgi:hypothetical protein